MQKALHRTRIFRQRMNRKPVLSVRAAAILAIAFALLAGVAPVSAHTNDPYIWIERIDGRFAIQGRHFPANSRGMIDAELGNLQGRKPVHTWSNGYFWVEFFSFTPEFGGPASASVNVNGVKASATANLAGKRPPVAEVPSEPTPTTEAPKTTTTTAKPKSTTTTTKPPASRVTRALSTSTSSADREGWNLTMSDDFNGDSLDRSKWGAPYQGRGNAGIGQRSPSAVSVSDGELRIRGTGDVAGGLASARSQTYGRYEIRSRVDSGTGYNTATLLWPKSGNWPEDGEIDISEIFNGNTDRAGSFVHWGANNDQDHHFEETDFTQWHTWAVEWTPNRLTWFLDGREIWTVTEGYKIPDNSHFLALQLDVSGKSRPNPVTFHVDYVRMYSR